MWQVVSRSFDFIYWNDSSRGWEIPQKRILFFFFLRGKFIARHRQVTSMKNGRGPMFPGRLVLIYSSFPRIKRWKKIFKNEEKYGKIADLFNLNSGNFCWILTLETNFLKIVLYGKNRKKIRKIRKKLGKFPIYFRWISNIFVEFYKLN